MFHNNREMEKQNGFSVNNPSLQLGTPEYPFLRFVCHYLYALFYVILFYHNIIILFYIFDGKIWAEIKSRGN